ncbi:MAG: KEOPS complex subunit Cgi121 [Candidatus Bathyarchaeia archaeon]|jgi:tRNA threonylcarbamoyladenosine modification (KEOPS) complex Cgi121 subunit
MLHYFEEFGVYCEVTGFKGVRFSDAEGFLKESRKRTRLKVEMQFFDANVIASYRHLYFAVLNALQAFQNKTNLSRSLAVETMLYASAQRQIQKAIQRCGIKPQTANMATTIIGEKPGEIRAMVGEIKACVGAEPDETVLEMTEVKLERIKVVFQIKAEEIKSVMKDECQTDAVVNLVVERVALLATQL